MKSHQSYEERAVLFLIWCFVLIPVCFFISLRTGGWLTAVLFTLPHAAGAVLFWYFHLRKEQRMLKDGEYYPGTIIAYGAYFDFQRYCMAEVEFFVDGQRYTTAQHIRGSTPRERLASASCTVCCFEEKGMRHCVVRELHYHKKWDAVGIDVPQTDCEKLECKLGIACPDGVPPEKTWHISGADAADYKVLYEMEHHENCQKF